MQVIDVFMFTDKIRASVNLKYFLLLLITLIASYVASVTV